MLTRIDKLLLREYPHLDSSDECYFLREYTPGHGYAWSVANGLISSFKTSPALRDTPQWGYKREALEQLARELQASVDPAWLRRATLVPMPPSKAPGHPEHDDRMLQLLQKLGPAPLDVRELLYQARSMDAAHASPDRPQPDEVAASYRISETLSEPAPTQIGLFDDVLTTGAHFRAAQEVLRARFPGVPIHGIFLARTVRLDKAGTAPQLP